MGGCAAIGVDNDLAAGEASVAVRPADDELAGRVDRTSCNQGSDRGGALVQRLADIGLDHGADLLAVPLLVEMLCGQDDLRHFLGLPAFITHGHLTLGVGAELAGIALARMARGCQKFQNLVPVIDRGRHEFRGLAAGVTEHDALIAGTFGHRLAGVRCLVHALRNITRLGVQQDVDASRLPVEAILLVANGADRLAGRGNGTLDGFSVGSPRLSIRTLPSLSFFNSVCGTRTSPAITTRFVVVSVSQATRILEASVAETAA